MERKTIRIIYMLDVFSDSLDSFFFTGNTMSKWLLIGPHEAIQRRITYFVSKKKMKITSLNTE